MGEIYARREVENYEQDSIRQGKEEEMTAAQTAFDPQEYIIIGDDWIGRPCDILMLNSNSNYTEIVTTTRKFFIRRHLHQCESRLPAEMFFRAERGCIVNLSHVKKIWRHDTRRYALKLNDDYKVIMSQNQSRVFRKKKSL